MMATLPDGSEAIAPESVTAVSTKRRTCSQVLSGSSDLAMSAAAGFDADNLPSEVSSSPTSSVAAAVF